MNIIFKENLQDMPGKYTILDLDTFIMPDGSTQTACCLVENIPITEMSQTEHLKALHAGLIRNYGQKNWAYCEQAVEQLQGKWGGEIDTYYADIQARIQRLKTLDLDDTWSPLLVKS